MQFELLDGLLLITSAPEIEHQRFARGIFVLLDSKRTHRHEVFFAPLDWRPDNRTSLQPDVLVVTADHVLPRNVTGPMSLAVEALSPSTRRKDQVLKRSKYEDVGVPASDLVDGRYVDAGSAVGDEELHLQLPFPVGVVPRTLRG